MAESAPPRAGKVPQSPPASQPQERQPGVHDHHPASQAASAGKPPRPPGPTSRHPKFWRRAGEKSGPRGAGRWRLRAPPGSGRAGSPRLPQVHPTGCRCSRCRCRSLLPPPPPPSPPRAAAPAARKNMASSISVSYGVTKMYGNMKMQKSLIPAETKNCLSDGRRRRAQRPW
nr:WW domain-binding protein 11-like [Peromyscus maniculatus bairdii]